jgi:hypothetical protein
MPHDKAKMRDTSRDKKLRIGIADNFNADNEVTAAFKTAVETIRLGQSGYE